MKCILALNHHWYDALLNYSPTKLTIDNQQLSPENTFIQSLKQESLKDLQHLKIDGLYDTPFAIGILKVLNEKNFSLTSLDMHDFVDCKTNEPDLENFFEKHCSKLKVLELENCWDSDWNQAGPFTKLVSRKIVRLINPSRANA